MKRFQIALMALVAAVSLPAAEYLVGVGCFPQAHDIQLISDETAQNGAFLHFQSEKATTEKLFFLPQAGDYAVWIRTMSFNGNFRKVAIHLNDKHVATLGDGTPENGCSGGFTWYHAPALTHLGAGSLKITLVSTSPYTRVDALLLTTDTQFKPQGQLKDIAELKTLSE